MQFYFIIYNLLIYYFFEKLKKYLFQFFEILKINQKISFNKCFLIYDNS